jgi:methyl-accepting chemotaxis protein
MNISNLKIGVRLGLGFGVVLVLLLAITMIGISRLAEQNDSADHTINNIYPKAAEAQMTAYLSMDIARIIRNLILNKDPAALASNKAAIDKNREQITELLGRLDKSVTTDEGRALMKDITATRAAFVSYSNEVIELALKNANEEASRTLYGSKYPTQAAYLTALKNMVAFQEKRMAEGGSHGRQVYRSALTLMVSLGVAAFVIGTAFAIWVTGSVTGPIGRAVKIAETVAAGDLSSHIEVSSTDETGQLLQALKNMNASLLDIVGQVRSGADTMATASGQIASGNLDLSSRTEQQASSLEETASSMEELTSTVKQNGDNARQANTLAVSASNVAIKGGQVVSQVVDTMGSINESARKIVDIIGVIDGIAFQTNILALNAAVEAARAGEQGRGFAVVAAEVRNLAQRSAGAAKEIKALIDDSVEKVGIGSRLVDQAGSTMDEVVASVRRVTDIMGEITSASREQESGIEQINQAITEMDAVTQQNASLVEEAAAAAEALQEQAGQLAQMVSVFKLGTGTGPALAATAARAGGARVVPLAKARKAAIRSAPRALETTSREAEWEQF